MSQSRVNSAAPVRDGRCEHRAPRAPQWPAVHSSACRAAAGCRPLPAVEGYHYWSQDCRCWSQDQILQAAQWPAVHSSACRVAAGYPLPLIPAVEGYRCWSQVPVLQAVSNHPQCAQTRRRCAACASKLDRAPLHLRLPEKQRQRPVQPVVAEAAEDLAARTPRGGCLLAACARCNYTRGTPRAGCRSRSCRSAAASWAASQSQFAREERDERAFVLAVAKDVSNCVQVRRHTSPAQIALDLVKQQSVASATFQTERLKIKWLAARGLARRRRRTRRPSSLCPASWVRTRTGASVISSGATRCSSGSRRSLAQ